MSDNANLHKLKYVQTQWNLTRMVISVANKYLKSDKWQFISKMKLAHVIK